MAHERPRLSTIPGEAEMLRAMGCDVAADELPEESRRDPRECRVELPPIDGRRPFADDGEKAQAIRRVVEQAERERASDS